MEEKFICDRCDTPFNSKAVLKRHKNTAKYCVSKSDDPKFKCKYCNYYSGRKEHILAHKSSCKKKDGFLKDKQIEELEVDILNLEEELKIQAQEFEDVLEESISSNMKEIARLKSIIRAQKAYIREKDLLLSNKDGKIEMCVKHPKTIVNINPKLMNVNCQTIRPFTIETVKEDIEKGKFTFDRFVQGINGIVDFINDIILVDDQRNYVCTDPSRNKFHRLLKTKEWKDDNGATFLNNVMDELKDPVEQHKDKIIKMMKKPEEMETGEFLNEKTKKIYIGITDQKSKCRNEIFVKIRAEVKNKAVI